MKDYKNNPQHTIKAIVHSANMGRLEEGTLEKIKPDPSPLIDLWHAVIGTTTCEITIYKQKAEAVIITV
jgi:hypothetical protein